MPSTWIAESMIALVTERRYHLSCTSRISGSPPRKPCSCITRSAYTAQPSMNGPEPSIARSTDG